jgi:GT2 family glycosyltransferase
MLSPPRASISEESESRRQPYDVDQIVSRKDSGSRPTVDAQSVGVVILDLNRPDLVDRCVDSIAGPCLPRIFVVENGTTPVEAFRTSRSWTYVRNDRNLGFAAGMNVGARAAVQSGCEYIVFLNNDTVFLIGSPILLAQALSESSRIGVLVPVEVPLLAPPAESVRRTADDERRPGILPVDRISGFCMAVRVELLRLVGLLDEDFFFTKEDDEFGYRVRRSGFSLAISTEVRLGHVQRASTKGASRNLVSFVAFHQARGHALLARKTGSPMTEELILAIYETTRLIAAACLSGGTIHASAYLTSIRGFRNGATHALNPPPSLSF